jgi:hypothetical protein
VWSGGWSRDKGLEGISFLRAGPLPVAPTVPGIGPGFSTSLWLHSFIHLVLVEHICLPNSGDRMRE